MLLFRLSGAGRVWGQRQSARRQYPCTKRSRRVSVAQSEYARRITDLPLLVRMDAGNDALENLNVCLNEEVDFIVKRNLRRESPEEWLMIAKQDGMCCEEREGKRVYLGSMEWTDKKLERPIRVVYQVIERTVEADG